VSKRLNIGHTELNKVAVLTDLSISRYIGGKQDRKATQEVESNHSIQSGEGGRFVKALIRPESLKPINRVAYHIRENFYRHTLPFRGECRILPTKLVSRFSETHRKLVKDFDKLADELARNFDGLVDEAKGRLNGLFNPDDYPATSQEFRDKFGVELAKLPFARTTDLSSPEDQERARQLVAGAITNAHHDLLNRVVEVVDKFQAVLSDPEAIFRDQTIHRVAEVIEEARDLNFSGDPQIDSSLAEAGQRLKEFSDPNTLRENRSARDQATSTARAVLGDLKSLASAFSGSTAKQGVA